MKSLLLIGLIVALSHQAWAQRTVEKGGHITDEHLDKFVGIWQGTTGKDTLTIVFEKHKVYFKNPADVYMDLILGWYKYIEGDLVVDDYLEQVGSPSIKKSFFNGNTDDNINELTLSFRDPKREKSMDATFRLVSTKSNKAVLKLSFSEGVYVYFGDEKSKKNVQTLPVPSTWEMKELR